MICDGVATRCMITRRKPSAASEFFFNELCATSCGVWTKQTVTGPATSGSEHVPMSLVRVGVGGRGAG